MTPLQKSLYRSILALFVAIGLLGCGKKQTLHTITVEEFAEFVEATGYQTDAEKFGWSIVQKTVYEYDVVNGSTWRLPNGKDVPRPNDPVTQVSYNDALAYCEWAGTTLPDYEQYWEAAKDDQRGIVMNNTQILPVADVNVVGNTWDITTTRNFGGEIRLAGGSYLCAPSTCNGTDPERTLFVSADTGNTHISFSVFR